MPFPMPVGSRIRPAGIPPLSVQSLNLAIGESYDDAQLTAVIPLYGDTGGRVCEVWLEESRMNKQSPLYQGAGRSAWYVLMYDLDGTLSQLLLWGMVEMVRGYYSFILYHK